MHSVLIAMDVIYSFSLRKPTVQLQLHVQLWSDLYPQCSRAGVDAYPRAGCQIIRALGSGQGIPEAGPITDKWPSQPKLSDQDGQEIWDRPPSLPPVNHVECVALLCSAYMPEQHPPPGQFRHSVHRETADSSHSRPLLLRACYCHTHGVWGN
jgi:hypothetical protein